LASPPGAPPYAQLKARAEPIEIDSRSVLIASIEDLVAMKRTAGRPRDLEDIEALQELRRIRAEATRRG
jgi:predicted nucleotidyltransferase